MTDLELSGRVLPAKRCDWGDCGRPAVGWRFWPGADNPWDHVKGGWRNPPWLPVCGWHLPRRPHEWVLAS